MEQYYPFDWLYFWFDYFQGRFKWTQAMYDIATFILSELETDL